MWELPKRKPVVKKRNKTEKHGMSVKKELSDELISTYDVLDYTIQVFGDDTFLITYVGREDWGPLDREKMLEWKYAVWKRGIADVEVTDVKVEHAPSAETSRTLHRTLYHRMQLMNNTAVMFVNKNGEILEVFQLGAIVWRNRRYRKKSLVDRVKQAREIEERGGDVR